MYKVVVNGSADITESVGETVRGHRRARCVIEGGRAHDFAVTGELAIGVYLLAVALQRCGKRIGADSLPPVDGLLVAIEQEAHFAAGQLFLGNLDAALIHVVMVVEVVAVDGGNPDAVVVASREGVCAICIIRSDDDVDVTDGEAILKVG